MLLNFSHATGKPVHIF